ncbi:hypothetical protein KCU85_g280, partial [Aureobasidium melanogenum]
MVPLFSRLTEGCRHRFLRETLYLVTSEDSVVPSHGMSVVDLHVGPLLLTFEIAHRRFWGMERELAGH